MIKITVKIAWCIVTFWSHDIAPLYLDLLKIHCHEARSFASQVSKHAAFVGQQFTLRLLFIVAADPTITISIRQLIDCIQRLVSELDKFRRSPWAEWSHFIRCERRLLRWSALAELRYNDLGIFFSWWFNRCELVWLLDWHDSDCCWDRYFTLSDASTLRCQSWLVPFSSRVHTVLVNYLTSYTAIEETWRNVRNCKWHNLTVRDRHLPEIF